MGNKLFMTNIANLNRNKTKDNEFETVQLPAPDILRMRFEGERQRNINYVADHEFLLLLFGGQTFDCWSIV